MEKRSIAPILVFERDVITDFVGDEKDKIAFLQKFPRVANFSKKGTVFHASGIFQIGNGPTILVLPWFYKNKNELFTDQVVFDSIKEISVYKESLLSLNKDGNLNALDLILRSFFLKLNQELDKVIDLNFHNDTYEEVASIKGKWNINRDLRSGPRPLKFSCTFGNLDKNHPILNFTKAFLMVIKRNIKSTSNSKIVKNAIKKLVEVPTENISPKLIQEAKNAVKTNKHFSEWLDLINFAESMLLDKDIYDPKAGVSFKFEMDKFFEELVYQLGRLVYPKGTHTQHREEILGRSYWTSDSQIVSLDRVKNNMSSRPDVFIEADKDLFILECKYKPFKIPYINDSELGMDMSSFGRDDRNQLLSFLISLTPSSYMTGKKVHTAVLFPCRSVKDYKVSSLVFSNAKFKIDSISKSISQIKSDVNEDNRLEVKFVGLNIQSCLIAIKNKDREFATELLLRIGGQYVAKRKHENKSAFNQALDRRLGLASYIVDKGRNDKTLGRIKLAKIIYMMDAHLKLNLMGQYERRAAGPYNPRMFRHEKYGIESLAEKQRYFKKIEQANASGEVERVRYVVGGSLEHGKKLAEELFFDKQEEIERIFNLFSNLNTDRSEIVATLYACWNDLIKRGRDTSDENIIQDMKKNWHKSKERFTDDRLKSALQWMRDNNLIPDGNAPDTKELIQIETPANF